MATTQGTIEHLDPATLDVEINVRTEADLGREFIDSIRANGVIQPVVAYRDDSGIHVRYGQRRTRAAQLVDLETIPVYVVDVDHSDTAQRIVEQLVENDQRTELTESDRLEAWRQLELDGLSVAKIAKRTGTKRDKIKTGLAVASSDTGTRLVSEGGMTLDQAATLLEFEDDSELVADLTRVATDDPQYFPVAVQRARNDREAERERQRVENEELEKGHRILDTPPSWDAKTPCPLHQLKQEDGSRVSNEDVQGKAGVAVHVSISYDGKARTTYYVDDPAALGYSMNDLYGSSTKSGPMTEEQKAERKELIANNKEWDAAETVRRNWIMEFLARKVLPKNLLPVLASHMVTGRHLISQSLAHGNSTAKELLGLTEKYDFTKPDCLAEYLDNRPNQAQHVTAAIVLGGIEETTSRDTWRYPQKATAKYLMTLAEWGYNLSPVEKKATEL